MPQDLTKWNLELIRLTLFFSNQPSFDVLEHWLNKISNNPADQIQKTKIAFSGQTLVGDSTYELKFESNRLDLYKKSNPQNNIANIGTIEDLNSEFDLIIKWIPELRDWPSPQRLAIGANSFYFTKEYREANAILADLLPNVKINIEESLDLLYRINRRTPSDSLEGVVYNNLTTWQNTMVQVIKLEGIIPEGTPPGLWVSANQKPIGDPKPACQMQFDMSTVPGTGTNLTTAQQIIAIKELIENIMLIARNGDKEISSVRTTE